jgi:hypothetical protein
MCLARNCRRARYEGSHLCVLHYADQLWSTAVKARDGYCRGAMFYPGVRCQGRLEADHLISRSYGATRFLVDVGVTLCLAHHKYMTEHPLEHEELAFKVMGRRAYEEKRRLALSLVPERPEDAIVRLEDPMKIGRSG